MYNSSSPPAGSTALSHTRQNHVSLRKNLDEGCVSGTPRYVSASIWVSSGATVAIVLCAAQNWAGESGSYRNSMSRARLGSTAARVMISAGVAVNEGTVAGVRKAKPVVF